MRSLNDRERRIIRLRFFEGRTQMEVAREIHLSPNKRKEDSGPFLTISYYIIIYERQKTRG